MNNYNGVIIEESLENTDVLKKVKILSTKVEEITDAHKTPWIAIWTLHTVEIPENEAQNLAEEISRSEEYNKAKHYGISLGIPKFQLDFAPGNKIWDLKSERNLE